ncbi:MAG: site-specific integrase [Proteobacteria bacterium]|nr:site-specific integrase [Pseudomonadota bacterium]
MGVKNYKLGDQTFWKADFRVHLPDGREKRIIKKKIPTKEMALAYETKIRAEVFEGRYFERMKSLTVREVWTAYEPVTRRENRAWRDDVNRAKRLLEHLGSAKAEMLTQRHVDEYRTKRESETTRRGNAPAVSTINREIGLLKRFLNHGVRRGDLRVNPIAHVRLLREDNVRQVVINEEQFTLILKGAKDWFKPILLVAFETGMRRSEILHLRWDQLDIRQGVIRLAQADTKSGKPRIIILTTRVKNALASLPRPIKGGFVFTNSATDKPYNDIKKQFKRACHSAGMEGVWFHDLRRSFVTAARRRGVPESVIMKMTGHRTRNVFERYNVVSDDDLRTAVELIEKGREREMNEAKEKAVSENTQERENT